MVFHGFLYKLDSFPYETAHRLTTLAKAYKHHPWLYGGGWVNDLWLWTNSRQPFGHRASFTSRYAESTDKKWEAVASNGDVDGAHELIQRLLEDPDTKSQVTRVTACV